MRRRALLSTLALAAVAMAGAVVAQVLVLHAEGPSAATYPSGSLLAADKVLMLRPGDHLTLLDGGGVRRIDGPAAFRPRQPSARTRSALSQIFARTASAPSRVGAARGLAEAARAGVPPVRANFWQIDISWPGAFCISPGQPVSLWRPSTDAVAIEITRMADRAKRLLTWPAGQATLDWPADLPLTDGETYMINGTDGTYAGIKWRVVGAPSGDWDGFAAELADKRCYAQLDSLRAMLDPPATP